MEEPAFEAMVRDQLALLVRARWGFDLFTQEARAQLGVPPPVVGEALDDNGDWRSTPAEWGARDTDQEPLRPAALADCQQLLALLREAACLVESRLRRRVPVPAVSRRAKVLAASSLLRFLQGGRSGHEEVALLQRLLRVVPSLNGAVELWHLTLGQRRCEFVYDEARIRAFIEHHRGAPRDEEERRMEAEKWSPRLAPQPPVGSPSGLRAIARSTGGRSRTGLSWFRASDGTDADDPVQMYPGIFAHAQRSWKEAGFAESTLRSWVREVFGSVRPFDVVPSRLRTLDVMYLGASSGPGADRRSFRFWSCIRRWAAGLVRGLIRELALGSVPVAAPPFALSKSSIPGGHQMLGSTAQKCLKLNTKLMHSLLKKNIVGRTALGAPAPAASELRYIQSAHTVVRLMETLVGTAADASLHLEIGGWQVVWIMGRLGVRNLVELCFWMMSVEHEDDDGAVALLDLL